MCPVNNNVARVYPTVNQDDIMKVWEQLLEQSSKLQVKTTFKADYGVSPIISLPNITFKGLLTRAAGSYVGVTTKQSQSQFDHVKIQFDAEIPDGCKVTPYYSIDGGQSWKTMSNDGTSPATPTLEQNVGIKYTRYIYECDVPGITDKYHLAQSFKARLRLDAPNNFTSPYVKKLICLMSNKNHQLN